MNIILPLSKFIYILLSFILPLSKYDTFTTAWKICWKICYAWKICWIFFSDQNVLDGIQFLGFHLLIPNLYFIVCDQFLYGKNNDSSPLTKSYKRNLFSSKMAKSIYEELVKKAWHPKLFKSLKQYLIKSILKPFINC